MQGKKGGYDDLVRDYVHPPESASGRQTALKVLNEWTNATENKDLEKLRSLMNDDIVIELPFNESGKTDKESYRIYRGIEACVGFWVVAFKAEGEMHMPSESELTVSSDGARVFLETRGHLTMSSGKDYRNRYVMRLDIKNGRVSHVKEYYNPIQSAYAFGRPIAGKFMLDEL